jgi:hypothetical protein
MSDRLRILSYLHTLDFNLHTMYRLFDLNPFTQATAVIYTTSHSLSYSLHSYLTMIPTHSQILTMSRNEPPKIRLSSHRPSFHHFEMDRWLWCFGGVELASLAGMSEHESFSLTLTLMQTPRRTPFRGSFEPRCAN